MGISLMDESHAWPPPSLILTQWRILINTKPFKTSTRRKYLYILVIYL